MGILLDNGRILLSEDFIIDKIIDREEEKKKIEEWINKKIGLIYIYGSSGTGKTHVIKKILENYKDKTVLYLNCSATNTFYKIMVNCLEKLKELKFIEKFHEKGLSGSELFSMLREAIEKNSVYFILVVDEINRLKLEDIDNLMYIGLDAINNYKNGWVFIIAISNDVMLDTKFSEAVKSRLSIKIHFPRYNVQQILDILEEYAKLSLIENSYTREDLFKIAEYVGNLTGDIRLAKRLLLSIAEKSDSRLDISKMAEAITENEKFMWEREIRKLSIELRLTLLAVIEANRFYEKKRETFVTANLKRFIFSSRIEPNLKNIYKHYCLICEEYGFNPKSEITFRNSIDELDRQMLIRKEVKGLGRGKGVTSLVYLRGYADVLEPIIRKSIEEVI